MAFHKTPKFASLEEQFYFETITKAQLFEMVRDYVCLANCLDNDNPEWINKLAENYGKEIPDFSVSPAGEEPLIKAIKGAAKERIAREKRAKRTS